MATKSARAEGPITRPDIPGLRAVALDAKRVAEVEDAERKRTRPTVRPPSTDRPSLIRLRGPTSDWPHAVIDVVTADGSKDGRRE